MVFCSKDQQINYIFFTEYYHVTNNCYLHFVPEKQNGASLNKQI